MTVHYLSHRSRVARAIAGDDLENPGRCHRRDLTSEEKRVARTAARKGMTLAQIGVLLSWDMSIASLRAKLGAINIKMNRGSGRNAETAMSSKTRK